MLPPVDTPAKRLQLNCLKLRLNNPPPAGQKMIQFSLQRPPKQPAPPVRGPSPTGSTEPHALRATSYTTTSLRGSRPSSDSPSPPKAYTRPSNAVAMCEWRGRTRLVFPQAAAIGVHVNVAVAAMTAAGPPPAAATADTVSGLKHRHPLAATDELARLDRLFADAAAGSVGTWLPSPKSIRPDWPPLSLREDVSKASTGPLGAASSKDVVSSQRSPSTRPWGPLPP